ncbi:MAG: Ig domain-containing protein [Terriglobia bacterium]
MGVHVLRPKAQTAQENAPPCCSEEAPRQLEFPYYSLRDGFNATLLLVSDSPKPLDFVLALHSRSGRTLIPPSMSIQPQEKLPVDLGTLLASLSADVTGDFSEGSVSIYFTGTIMPLAGQLTMTNPLKSLSLESEMVDNSPGLGLLPPVLNAVWWSLGGGREGRIMVTNTSGDSVTADVFLDFQGQRHDSAPLAFAPHETKVLSIAGLLGDLKVSPAQAPEGGITIIHRGPKPALIAQGKITDPTTGFSTSLNFMDPSLQRASALHASGVPIGLPSKDSPYAGTGVFVPHVIVRNMTPSPQTATVTIEYPAEKTTRQYTLPPVALGPYSTVDVALDSVFGMLPLPLPYCSIRIQYSGPPGSVIGEVSSVESKGDLVIDSRLANEGDGWAGSGAHPWHLDAETESVLILTNMGDKECRMGFRVQAAGVHYFLTDLSLKPHEVRAIDIRKLRDAQKPDFQGNVIPAGATDGSVLWARMEDVPVTGRLVVLQRHKGVASNYTCGGGCPCPANSFSVAVTCQGDPILVLETDQHFATENRVDCNQLHFYNEITNYSGWTSSTPAVATVNNSTHKGLATGVSGGTTTIVAQFSTTNYQYIPYSGCRPQPVNGAGNRTCPVAPHITSVSPTQDPLGDTYTVILAGNGFGAAPSSTASVNAGSGIVATIDPVSTDTSIKSYFLIQASAPGGNHSVTVTTNGGTSNSVNFYVQIPTTAVKYSDTGVSESQCTLVGGGTGCGSGRDIKWQFKDQRTPTPQPISAVLNIYDTITIGPPDDFHFANLPPNTTCPNNTGPCDVYTGSDGITGLDHNDFCSASCISGGACIDPGLTTVVTQTWHANGREVQPHTYTFACGQVLVDGQP